MKKSTTGLFGILVLLLASLWMTGCQDLKNVKESTVTVDKKGAVAQKLWWRIFQRKTTMPRS